METNTTLNISHIYKNLYISDISAACDISSLIDNKIFAVLHLGNHYKDAQILKEYASHNIEHMFLKINDSLNSNISACFESAWEFINNNIKKHKNILIHCTKGISRSPTIVAYYLTRKMHDLMKKNSCIGPVLDDILTLIKAHRPCIKPNRYFIQQLKNYENINININTLVK
jgi:protein-tyrosine phosphatase